MNDRGAWHDVPDELAWAWSSLGQRYKSITEKHPKALSNNIARHLGTLGTGNHFIKICLDESDSVWTMLHSGSRGCANRIGTYFIEGPIPRLRTGLQDHAFVQSPIVLPFSVLGRNHLGNPG